MASKTGRLIIKNFLFEDKSVLITGGSSGIGLDLARLFLKERSRVVLIAKDGEKLNAVASGLEQEFQTPIVSLAKDLSNSSAAQEIHEFVLNNKITVELLVNNAGFGATGKFEAMDLDKSLGMIDVNIKALVSLTRLFLPSMIKNGFGKILNVASTAGFQAVPIEIVYAATKAFVILFSEGLTNELEGTGVGVTCLCPGPTETAFFTRGDFSASQIMKRQMMPSPVVAQMALSALKKNKTLVITGLANQAGQTLGRFVPRQWVTRLARRVVE